jgi:hypothetical protein
LGSIFLQKENPDRYAAAICIAIRSDCYADILKAEAGTCPCCEDAAGFRRYPDATKFSSNGYFFFFLAVFFAFFAFFAFLAMLPSVIPKVELMQVISTCMHLKYTTIAKLILNASKKVNDRRAIATNEVAWSRRVARTAQRRSQTNSDSNRLPA